MRNRMNWRMSLGMLLLVVPLGVARFLAVPDFVQGFCIGAGLGLMLLGLCRGASRLQNWKRDRCLSLFSRL